MGDWQTEFLESHCAHAEAVIVGDGAFSPGPAIWIGRREIAHFDEERCLDVRLTKAEIRKRRDEFRSDGRVALRGSGSDWIQLTVESDEDLGWATGLVHDAIAANLPTAPAGPPPTPPISKDGGVSTDARARR